MNVTEQIGESYLEWKANDIITIKAGTGKGKSHFIKNTLYEYAKQNDLKMLMLIHRINCVDQFQMEIERENKDDIIHIKTYQSLEYKSKRQLDLSKYNIIVCDEFHYFMSDAAFNVNTDISLNKILQQEFSIRIFMSATGDKMDTYISNKLNVKPISYKLESEYEHINSLSLFNKDQSYELLVKRFIEQDIKCIFFIQSSTKAYDLYKQFKKYSLFNCGKGDKHYRYVNKVKIKNMLANESFEEQFLFTTSCMDSGVNIKDEQLKSIVCEIDDTGTLIQCIGRKRMLNSNDRVDVYLKYLNPYRLGGIETNYNKKLDKARFLLNNTVNEYIQEYGRDKDLSYIVYDETVEGENNKSTKKVNELLYHKYLNSVNEITMIKNSGKYGYAEYMKELFKQEEYKFFEGEHNGMNLNEYLDSIVGKQLYKEEQKELKEVFKKNGLNAKTLGINTLNGNLKDRKLPYLIIAKRTNSKRYWEVASNIIN